MPAATPISESFPPIVGDRARLLILGNMPGAVSLAARQYYAHPRNAFWRITGALFGFDATADYQMRTAALRDNGVAVWDVLKSCRRRGSLDSAVEPDSMVGNDFGEFFAAHPTIELVVFNGAAAERNFARLGCPSPTRQLRLPSTSPAHTMRYEDKLRAWRDALDLG